MATELPSRAQVVVTPSSVSWKGLPGVRRELTPDQDPVEAGLLFTCKLGTDHPFLGRDAVERVRPPAP